jgi:hypothetical protein
MRKNNKIREIGNPGYGNSGIQEPGNPGIQESRTQRIQESRNLGLQGIQGILRHP